MVDLILEKKPDLNICAVNQGVQDTISSKDGQVFMRTVPGAVEAMMAPTQKIRMASISISFGSKE